MSYKTRVVFRDEKAEGTSAAWVVLNDDGGFMTRLGQINRISEKMIKNNDERKNKLSTESTEKRVKLNIKRAY